MTNHVGQIHQKDDGRHPVIQLIVRNTTGIRNPTIPNAQIVFRTDMGGLSRWRKLLLHGIEKRLRIDRWSRRRPYPTCIQDLLRESRALVRAYVVRAIALFYVLDALPHQLVLPWLRLDRYRFRPLSISRRLSQSVGQYAARDIPTQEVCSDEHIASRLRVETNGISCVDTDAYMTNTAREVRDRNVQAGWVGNA
jgi:hypothetical protein